MKSYNAILIEKECAMVILKKISFSNEEVIYEYYPEGETEFPGIIVADLKKEKFFLKKFRKRISI